MKKWKAERTTCPCVAMMVGPIGKTNRQSKGQDKTNCERPQTGTGRDSGHDQEFVLGVKGCERHARCGQPDETVSTNVEL